MLKSFIMVVLFLVVIFFVGFWQFGAYFTNKEETEPFTLTVWSTKDEEALFNEVIKEYKKSHPYANIQFVRQTALNYRSRVQAQIAQNTGPDIFLLHESWVPMYLQTRSIAAMPTTKEEPAEAYLEDFYPIIQEALSSGGKVYAAAPFVDGLVVLVNEDLLKERGVDAPKTWDEFFTAAQKLNAFDEEGNIRISGAAIGTTNNVDFWSDLVGLLYLQQPETDLMSPGTEKGADVLRFYTQFASPKNRFDRTWDSSKENSLKAFGSGKVAMAISNYEKAQEIRSAHPNLKFRAIPVPQLPTKNVTWGSFWVYGVSNGSAQKEKAWEFLKFLTSAHGEKTLNQAIKNKYGYMMPYSRKDLQKEQVNDPLLGPIVTQAPLMKTWFLAYGTNDQGLNDTMIATYKTAVDKSLNGVDPLSSLSAITPDIEKALADYTTPLPAK